MDGSVARLLLALGAALSGAALLAITIGLLQPGWLAGGWVKSSLQEFVELRGAGKTAAILFLFVMTGGAGLLAGVEIAALRREVTARDSEGQRFGISRAGLTRTLRQMCESLRGVDEARPHIKGGSRGLRVECAASLEPRFNPIDVSQRLRTQVKGSVESIVGIPVRDVTVRLGPPRRGYGDRSGFTT